jgi:hypothetical protein
MATLRLGSSRAWRRDGAAAGAAIGVGTQGRLSQATAWRGARGRAPLGLEKLRGNLTIKSDFAMERLNFSGFSQHVSDKSWLGPLQVK